MDNQLHKIPLHLETDDTFLWSFTGRQVFIVALGLGVGYLIFEDVTMQVTPFTLSLGILLWVLVAAVAVVVAFVKMQHRSLEEWALVWLLYWTRPRYYITHPLAETIDASDNDESNVQQKEEQTRW